MARVLTDELVRCRRRGLGRLDSRVGSEPGLELPALARLCRQHYGGAVPRDRGVAIGGLIRATAEDLGRERPADAQLVVELFFGDSPANVPTASPGELLDAAAGRRPRMSEAVFRRQRRDTFVRFARAMVDFVERDAGPRPGNGVPASGAPTETAVVAAMAADPAIGTDELLERLREMAGEYEVDEVLDVILRFDTPDILG